MQIGLPLVILALFFFSVSRNWNALTVYHFQWNPWLLALSFRGSGIRQEAVAGLFALALPFIPTTVATVLALLSRFVSIVVELVCVSVAYLSGGKQVCAIQLEHSRQSLIFEDTARKDGIVVPASDVPSRVSVEGGVGSD